MYPSFAKKIAGEGLEAAKDEGLRFKQQEVLRDLLQVGNGNYLGIGHKLTLFIQNLDVK